MYVIQYILKDTKKKKYGDMSYTYAITHDFNIEDYKPYFGYDCYDIDFTKNILELVEQQINASDIVKRHVAVSDIITIENTRYYRDLHCWVKID